LKHKPWLDEGCSKLLDQRKQAKLQRLQDPSEINGDNMNNVRHEASRYSRNKKREYLKTKVMSLQLTVRTRTSETCIEE
jgi:Zn-finger nucleic acid-binding protein